MGGLGVAAGLLIVLLLALGPPLALSALAVLRYLAAPASRPLTAPLAPAVLGATLGYPALIAALATVLACPAAWFLRAPARSLAFRIALVATPLLLPAYLAYAALGLLRAPGTRLADLLSRQEPWIGLAVSKLLAVTGLTLWCWPLAALILAPAVRALRQDTLDALRLHAPSHRQRLAFLTRLLAPSLAGAFACLFLVMLGSAVPLHLAQIDTAATRLWRLLSLWPDPAPAWVAASPVAVVALVAALALARRLGRAPFPEAGMGVAPGDTRPGRTATACTLAILSASLLLPMLLFVRALAPDGGWPTAAEIASASARFWRDSGPAVLESARVALAVAAAAGLICASTWIGFSRPGDSPASSWARRLAAGACGLLLLGALLPGVLVGSALAHAVARPGAPLWLADSQVPLVVAHIARFGFLPALLGAWAAASGPAALRDLRRLDGATGLRFFPPLELQRAWTLPVGAAIAAFVLSFHEIEATVMLQPPGHHALAQQLLEQLHYARDRRLAAAALNLLGSGTLLALLAAYSMARPAVRAARGSNAQTTTVL